MSRAAAKPGRTLRERAKGAAKLGMEKPPKVSARGKAPIQNACPGDAEAGVPRGLARHGAQILLAVRGLWGRAQRAQAGGRAGKQSCGGHGQPEEEGPPRRGPACAGVSFYGL